EINESKYKNLFLILRLAIAFLLVSLFVLFFYYTSLDKHAISEKSIASTQANMFVVAATLFAPVAALIFVQDWKVQHNKNISSEIARKVWKNLDHVKKIIGEVSYIFKNLENLSDEEFLNLN